MELYDDEYNTAANTATDSAIDAALNSLDKISDRELAPFLIIEAAINMITVSLIKIERMTGMKSQRKKSVEKISRQIIRQMLDVENEQREGATPQ